MTPNQIELLAEIQRLVLSASAQTGRRVYHDVQSWGDGCIWSTVRVIEGDSTPLHSSRVVIDDGDDSVPKFEWVIDRCTLAEQRESLESWIANNCKQEDAA